MNTSTRYAYTHAVCGGPVTKEPTGKSNVSYIGIHGWSCNTCGGRGVKINRSMRPKNPVTVNAQNQGKPL